MPRPVVESNESRSLHFVTNSRLSNFASLTESFKRYALSRKDMIKKHVDSNISKSASKESLTSRQMSYPLNQRRSIPKATGSPSSKNRSLSMGKMCYRNSGSSTSTDATFLGRLKSSDAGRESKIPTQRRLSLQCMSSRLNENRNDQYLNNFSVNNPLYGFISRERELDFKRELQVIIAKEVSFWIEKHLKYIVAECVRTTSNPHDKSDSFFADHFDKTTWTGTMYSERNSLENSTKLESFKKIISHGTDTSIQLETMDSQSEGLLQISSDKQSRVSFQADKKRNSCLKSLSDHAKNMSNSDLVATRIISRILNAPLIKSA